MKAEKITAWRQPSKGNTGEGVTKSWTRPSLQKLVVTDELLKTLDKCDPEFASAVRKATRSTR